MLKQRLEGKVALITGAASGIGEETVKLFAENGAFVVAADIQDELGCQVVASIGSDRVTYHHCDVRDENQVEETINFTLEKHGRLDVLFSNAGVIGSLSGILDLDLNELDNTMAINVRGAAATIKHGARAMVAKKIRGSIICTTSVAATIGGTGPHELSIFKPHEVEENSCSQANLKGIVLKARHIAEAALYLASDEAIYVSGHNLVVDGGFSVVNPTSSTTPVYM
ncbi:Short-chain dehydrogenase/reductase SDR [Sesbania bispinosa]|nr:Short-chain dehydrogenase/reductase SDR [Sesbania bispinosa]